MHGAHGECSHGGLNLIWWASKRCPGEVMVKLRPGELPGLARWRWGRTSKVEMGEAYSRQREANCVPFKLTKAGSINLDRK